MGRLFLIFALIASFGLVSCAKSEQNADAESAVDLPTSNSDISAHANDSIDVSWLKVYEEVGKSDPVLDPHDRSHHSSNNAECQYPLKFAVQNDGQYTARACDPNYLDPAGKITSQELAELAKRANAVAQTNLLNQTCEPVSAKVSNFVELSVPPNAIQRIMEYKPARKMVCYRGDVAAAKSLAVYVHTLMNKYYSRNFVQ